MRLILDIPIPWSIFIKVHISINQNPLITGIIQLIALRIRVMADKNKLLTFSSNFDMFFHLKCENKQWCDILCICWRNMLISIQHQLLISLTSTYCKSYWEWFYYFFQVTSEQLEDIKDHDNHTTHEILMKWTLLLYQTSKL